MMGKNLCINIVTFDDLYYALGVLQENEVDLNIRCWGWDDGSIVSAGNLSFSTGEYEDNPRPDSMSEIVDKIKVSQS